MKPEKGAAGLIQAESLPTRERGLKLFWRGALPTFPQIAPHAGARIETIGEKGLGEAVEIAPHAGARIETEP